MHKRIKDRFKKKLKVKLFAKSAEAEKQRQKKQNAKTKKLFISLLNAQSTTNLMVQIKSQMD